MAPWVALLAACRLRGWISSRASTAAAAPAMAIRPLWDWAHASSLPRLRPAAGGGALSLSIVRLPLGLQQLLQVRLQAVDAEAQEKGHEHRQRDSDQDLHGEPAIGRRDRLQRRPRRGGQVELVETVLLPAPLGAGLAAPPRVPLAPRPPLGYRRHALIAPTTATPAATVQSPRRSKRGAPRSPGRTTAITITTSACQPNSLCSIRYSREIGCRVAAGSGSSRAFAGWPAASARPAGRPGSPAAGCRCCARWPCWRRRA